MSPLNFFDEQNKSILSYMIYDFETNGKPDFNSKELFEIAQKTDLKKFDKQYGNTFITIIDYNKEHINKNPEKCFNSEQLEELVIQNNSTLSLKNNFILTNWLFINSKEIGLKEKSLNNITKKIIDDFSEKEHLTNKICCQTSIFKILKNNNNNKKKNKKLLTTTNIFGQTPLHQAIICLNNKAVYELLKISKKQNINIEETKNYINESIVDTIIQQDFQNYKRIKEKAFLDAANTIQNNLKKQNYYK